MSVKKKQVHLNVFLRAAGKWIVTHAADGFSLMPPIYPHGLNDFVDKVIPELQNRGLFRTVYESTRLRDNLGLAYPANSLKKGLAAAP